MLLAVSERMCQKWFAKFSAGELNLEDASRSGRLVTMSIKLYSPELAPSNFHLFRSLQNSLNSFILGGSKIIWPRFSPIER
ncbi:hypothetical protein X777_12108 [Ooceraea biroi]|uniref:Mos1 transposase HTH domain-containing protein n=1 Tax=Ooceraea biroi TaxID=2015173 RepID=A0A026W0G5_OOCBI|nr:hypothetical protein X777_12108 [Ooceraea biroi]